MQPFYKISLFFIALALSYASNAQTIVTFAGSGIAGYNGDDEAATLTQLWSPAGIAVNGNNVYVADGLNNRIRKITTAGKFTTISGIDDPGYGGDSGPATDAQFNDPEGVAADTHGNIYIADKYNHRIRKITPDGKISAFAGNGNQGYSGDGGPAIAAQLYAPAGITTDGTGNVYFADAGNNCIRMVTVAGEIVTIAGTGKGGFNGNTGPAIAIQLNAPKSVAVDSAGNIYIADALNYRIRKVSPAGLMTTIAGNDTAAYSGDGDTAKAAKLNLPTGVAVDKSGNLFISDQGNNCIRKINTDGIISTVAGGGAGGGLSAPFSIALDGAGNIYVTEEQNNLVKRITPAVPQKIVKTKTKGTTTGRTYTPPPFQTFPAAAPAMSMPISNPTPPPPPAPSRAASYGGRGKG